MARGLRDRSRPAARRGRCHLRQLAKVAGARFHARPGWLEIDGEGKPTPAGDLGEDGAYSAHGENPRTQVGRPAPLRTLTQGAGETAVNTMRNRHWPSQKSAAEKVMPVTVSL
jgi:hypothetical protein